MNLRSNRGVTLFILSAIVVILIIIVGITVNYSQDYAGLNNINDLYSDIEAINVAISDYYLKNDNLPILKNEYLSNKQELEDFFTSEGAKEIFINPDDDGPYYVIDLSKLDNLTLKFGRSYKNWSDSSSNTDYKDLYIINSVTHQVYYANGIIYDGDVYFTRNSFGTGEG